MKRIDVDTKEYLESISKLEANAFLSLSAAADAAWDRILQGVQVFGAPMPWQKTHHNMRFRPGELSIWAGVNGHGKSLILSQCMGHWMQEGPLAIASFEMPLAALAERHAYQVLGGKDFTIDDFGMAMARTDNVYWVYDETDSVDPESALGMAVYAAKELQCKHIIIDSLVKCGLRMDSSNSSQSQRDFVDRLCWIAKTYDVHVHLVHHMRKGGSELEPGNKMDVKGAGEITDLADNVLLMWRNKPKEDVMQEDPSNLEYIEQPDACLTVAKQRHGEWEGRIKLWFDANSRQYLGSRHDRPMRLI